tara:strand:- start:545 stop:745 length:201 start_codon:yes stop_codon:yes gene_type:complete
LYPSSIFTGFRVHGKGEKLMSHPLHQARMEQLFEEGLEEGIAKGLEGKALDFFAERYAKKAISECD